MLVGRLLIAGRLLKVPYAAIVRLTGPQAKRADDDQRLDGVQQGEEDPADHQHRQEPNAPDAVDEQHGAVLNSALISSAEVI